MEPGGIFCQAGQIALPSDLDQASQPCHMVIEYRQQLQPAAVPEGLPEQGAALGQGTVVVAEHLDILGPQLGDGAVQEIPAFRGAVPHQGKMVRGKDHTAQLAGKGAPSGFGDAVDLHLPPGPEDIFQFLIPSLGKDIGIDPGALGFPVHIQPGNIMFPAVAEGFLPGEQPDGLHEVGFALGVVADNEVDPFPGGEVTPDNIAVILQGKAIDPHGQ